jgi:putative tryptophan/tyrosine transport system substrate-binding protein
MAIHLGRRQFISALGGVSLAWPLAARAQQGERMRRIGMLMTPAENDPAVRSGIAAFRQGPHELGWSEGRNLQIDYRWGGGDLDRIKAFAKELIELSPDVIVAHSTPPVVALHRGTSSIPIVFLTVTDPLSQGLVASLAHPGGNITGFSTFEFSTGTKWVETLKAISPSLRRVATIFNPEIAPYYPLYLRSIEKAASEFAVEPIVNEVHDDAEIERAISTQAREPGGGLIVMPDTFNVVHRQTIITLAARYSLPTIYYLRYFATDGGLISYGPDEIDLFRRTASYVDRILKGEKPGDLPVEQPTKFQLVINLKTAKALGLTVPLPLLATADELIE